MGITLRAPEEAILAGEAGRIMGEAARAKEEYRRATEIADRLASVKAQQEMTMFSHQLQLDRAKFDLQFDFQKEQRAKIWELEKMEIASKLDFAEEEKQRAQTNAEYAAGLKYVAENEENWPEGLAEKVRFDLYFDKKIKAPAVSYPKPTVETERQQIDKMLSQILQKPSATIETERGPMQLGQPIPTKETVQPAGIKEPSFWQKISPIGALTYLLGEKTTTTQAGGLPTEMTNVGQIITRGGKNYKVVGYDTDGTPLCQPM